jgi:hypothetical protein
MEDLGACTFSKIVRMGRDVEAENRRRKIGFRVVLLLCVGWAWV